MVITRAPGGRIVSVKLAGTLTAGTLESVTCSVTPSAGVTVVGVPVIVPVVVLKVSPAGNDPETIFQVVPRSDELPL